jgi:N-methylhydantoinase A
MRYDHVRSAFLRDDRPDGARLKVLLDALRASVEADFARDGVENSEIEIQYAADMRYLGQGYELRVAIDPAFEGAAALAAARTGFEAAHGRDYGRIFPDRVTEIVNLRVVGTRRATGAGLASAPRASEGAPEVARATCTFALPTGGESADTPFVLRARLRDGDEVPGPAIILQDDTTIVVPPRAVARCLPSKSILIVLAAKVST